MTRSSTIIFVCEHGAAKSVIAAVYFNKLANQKGLNMQAIARGTNPDELLSSKAVQGLREDGLQATESIPQKLTLEEIKLAQKVVTFCELPEEVQQGVEVETWGDVSPVSENYEIARDAILKKINSLITALQNA